MREGSIERTLHRLVRERGGDKKELSIQKSKEIQDVIARSGKWIKAKGNLKFDSIYGAQRGYKRL